MRHERVVISVTVLGMVTLGVALNALTAGLSANAVIGEDFSARPYLMPGPLFVAFTAAALLAIAPRICRPSASAASAPITYARILAARGLELVLISLVLTPIGTGLGVALQALLTGNLVWSYQHSSFLSPVPLIVFLHAIACVLWLTIYAARHATAGTETLGLAVLGYRVVLKVEVVDWSNLMTASFVACRILGIVPRWALEAHIALCQRLYGMPRRWFAAVDQVEYQHLATINE